MSSLLIHPRLFEWSDYLRCCSHRHDAIWNTYMAFFNNKRCGWEGDVYPNKNGGNNCVYVSFYNPIEGKHDKEMIFEVDDPASLSSYGENAFSKKESISIHFMITFIKQRVPAGYEKFYPKFTLLHKNDTIEPDITYMYYMSYFGTDAYNIPNQIFESVFLGREVIIVGTPINFKFNLVNPQFTSYSFVFHQTVHSWETPPFDLYDDTQYPEDNLQLNDNPNIDEAFRANQQGVMDKYRELTVVATLDQVALCVPNEQKTLCRSMEDARKTERVCEFRCRILSRGLPHCVQVLRITPLHEKFIRSQKYNTSNPYHPMERLFNPTNIDKDTYNTLNSMAERDVRVEKFQTMQPYERMHITRPKRLKLGLTRDRKPEVLRREKKMTHDVATRLSFICPLSHGWIVDPKKAADGIIYERTEIEDFFREKFPDETQDVYSPKDKSMEKKRVLMKRTLVDVPPQYLVLQKWFLKIDHEECGGEFYRKYISTLPEKDKFGPAFWAELNDKDEGEGGTSDGDDDDTDVEEGKEKRKGREGSGGGE